MSLWVGCDHGGYLLKKIICGKLTELNIEFNDIGGYSEEIVRYPYYASIVAKAISEGKAKRGILICSTGIGMSIMANRYPRVRASLCLTPYMARMTREHNDSNLLCMGGKITETSVALEILDEWLNTSFIKGRHEISLALIREAEEYLINGQSWEPELPAPAIHETL